MLNVKLTGLETIRANMRLVSDKAAIAAGRRALRKGGIVIRNAARQNAQAVDDPKTRASIVKNLAVQAGSRRREQSNGGPMVRVGVMGGAGSGKNDGSRDSLPGGETRHWRHIEFGTSRTPARPFLRPAAQSAGEAAIGAVVAAMDPELAKELRKLKK